MEKNTCYGPFVLSDGTMLRCAGEKGHKGLHTPRKEDLADMEAYGEVMRRHPHKFIASMEEIPPSCATCGLGEMARVHDKYREEGKS